MPETKKTILLHDGKATYNQLVRGITLHLIEEGVMHNPQVADLDYRKIFDSHFERIGRTKIWKLKESQKVSPLDYIPLNRRIEWIIFSVFNEKRKKKEKVTVSDILSAIFTILRNAKTPENREIIDILRGIAEPISEGGIPYWEYRKTIQRTLDYIPTEVSIEKIEPLETLDHNRIIRALSEIGQGFGFDIWIGDPEIRKESDLANYKTVDDLEIKAFDKLALKRLKNVDVIWLERKTIPRALLEVEHSTDPRQGLLRMANIFSELPYLDIPIFTILPDKKVSKLKEIIDEPSIKSFIGEKTVNYVPYSTIAEIIDDSEYKKLRFDDFIEVCETLKPF